MVPVNKCSSAQWNSMAEVLDAKNSDYSRKESEEFPLTPSTTSTYWLDQNVPLVSALERNHTLARKQLLSPQGRAGVRKCARPPLSPWAPTSSMEARTTCGNGSPPHLSWWGAGPSPCSAPAAPAGAPPPRSRPSPGVQTPPPLRDGPTVTLPDHGFTADPLFLQS